MSKLIPDSVIKHLAGRSYEKAAESVAVMKSDAACTPEMAAEYDALLAARKDKPSSNGHGKVEVASKKPEPSSSEDKADWQAIVQLKNNPALDALKAKFAAGDINLDEYTDQAQKMKSALSLAYNPAKGTVALRGVRRFTIAYYASEWQTILANGPAILAYLDEHAEELEEAEKAGK